MERFARRRNGGIGCCGPSKTVQDFHGASTLVVGLVERTRMRSLFWVVKHTATEPKTFEHGICLTFCGFILSNVPTFSVGAYPLLLSRAYVPGYGVRLPL